MEFAVELLSKLLVRRKIAVSSPGLAVSYTHLTLPTTSRV